MIANPGKKSDHKFDQIRPQILIINFDHKFRSQIRDQKRLLQRRRHRAEELREANDESSEGNSIWWNDQIAGRRLPEARYDQPHRHRQRLPSTATSIEQIFDSGVGHFIPIGPAPFPSVLPKISIQLYEREQRASMASGVASSKARILWTCPFLVLFICFAFHFLAFHFHR